MNHRSTSHVVHALSLIAVLLLSVGCQSATGPGVPPTPASDAEAGITICPPPGGHPILACRSTQSVCDTPPAIPDFRVIPGQSIDRPGGGGEPVTLDEVVADPGKGELCCGVAAKATTAVKLYRAWAPHYDQRSTAPSAYYATYQFGSWWSLSPPDLGSRDAYRFHADVCTTWSSLTVYSECTLPQGTEVFLGPGQSACCGDPGNPPRMRYLPQSSTPQIYVPQPAGAQGTLEAFTACTTYVWP